MEYYFSHQQSFSKTTEPHSALRQLLIHQSAGRDPQAHSTSGLHWQAVGAELMLPSTFCPLGACTNLNIWQSFRGGARVKNQLDFYPRAHQPDKGGSWEMAKERGIFPQHLPL